MNSETRAKIQDALEIFRLAALGRHSINEEGIQMLYRETSETLSAEPDEPTVNKSVEELAWKNLQGLYHCSRVWSAWSYGTMHNDDFSPAEDNDDLIAVAANTIQQFLDAQMAERDKRIGELEYQLALDRMCANAILTGDVNVLTDFAKENLMALVKRVTP